MHPLAYCMQDAELRKLVERHHACDELGLPEHCPTCGHYLEIDEREHEVHVCLACGDARDRELAR